MLLFPDEWLAIQQASASLLGFREPGNTTVRPPQRDRKGSGFLFWRLGSRAGPQQPEALLRSLAWPLFIQPIIARKDVKVRHNVGFNGTPLLQIVPEHHASLHHKFDSFHLSDVREWIARDRDDVGEPAFLHIANLVSQIVVQGLSG